MLCCSFLQTIYQKLEKINHNNFGELRIFHNFAAPNFGDNRKRHLKDIYILNKLKKRV